MLNHKDRVKKDGVKKKITEEERTLWPGSFREEFSSFEPRVHCVGCSVLAHVDEDDVRLEYTGHDTQEQLVHIGTRDFHLVDVSSPQILFTKPNPNPV